jgi:hypothetical protein
MFNRASTLSLVSLASSRALSMPLPNSSTSELAIGILLQSPKLVQDPLSLRRGFDLALFLLFCWERDRIEYFLFTMFALDRDHSADRGKDCSEYFFLTMFALDPKSLEIIQCGDCQCDPDAFTRYHTSASTRRRSRWIRHMAACHEYCFPPKVYGT